MKSDLNDLEEIDFGVNENGSAKVQVNTNLIQENLRSKEEVATSFGRRTPD
jgi:hypothetical protein